MTDESGWARPWDGRRLVDVLAGVVLLVLLAPAFLLLAGAVLATVGRPVLFAQYRLGVGRRPMSLLTYRSVVPGTPPRQPPFGLLLQRSGLRVLPALVHLVSGDLTLVGPPPARPWDPDDGPAPWRPGLTGLVAQNRREELRRRRTC